MTGRPTGADHRLGTAQMAEFVSRGILIFESLVPEEINAAAAAELTDAGSSLRRRYRQGSSLGECFHEHPGVGGFVGLPEIRGIVESLVGPDPIYDHHAIHWRDPGGRSQDLHGDAIIDLRAAFDIQLMYFPHEVGADAGGTLLVPGSHLRRINEKDIGRYQNMAGQIALACPAGTVVVAHHGLWHCGRRNHGDQVRYMFKLRLGARVPQVRQWDDSDRSDADVQDQVQQLLAEPQPWFEDATARLEYLQRAALWRRLTADPGFQIEFWLGRLENQSEPQLVDLVP